MLFIFRDLGENGHIFQGFGEKAYLFFFFFFFFFLGGGGREEGAGG